jgi:hypothetical protein
MVEIEVCGCDSPCRLVELLQFAYIKLGCDVNTLAI